ncbi:7tm 6 domain containing protein [Asbolus verrucosus]|uniref:7tm 6 domain containing protein n=1 Tax=Asbolus verrucosus TaxID=1661398 RepID=A0A482VRZ6_ASBVE|nr:7tm 6 domain containing protein [Asbolus verrucosus]
MERFDWKATINFTLFSLKIIGLWPKDDVYKFNLYTLYTAISVTFFISAFGVFLMISLFTGSDFEDLEEMTLIYVAEFLVIIKVFKFIKNIKLLKQLMATLNSDVFQPKTSQQKILVKPALQFWKIVYNVFLISGGPITCLWVFLPILRSKRYKLPVPVWYPFNTKISPCFEITYCYQIVNVFYLVIAICNIDMLISALMVYIGAQCDILSDSLRNLRDKEAVNFNSKLIDFIKHHKEILSYE